MLFLSVVLYFFMISECIHSLYLFWIDLNNILFKKINEILHHWAGRKNNLTETRLCSVKPGLEDNCHFNDRPFYLGSRQSLSLLQPSFPLDIFTVMFVHMQCLQECLTIFGSTSMPGVSTSLKMCYAGYGCPLVLV